MTTPDADAFAIVGLGYTGRRVLDALPARRTVVVNRSPVSIDGAQLIEADLDAPRNEPIELPPGARLLYTVPPPPDGDSDPRLENFLATVNGAPSRFVYLSTTGVYGDCNGNTVTENDAPAPGTGRARRRLHAEETLREWCAGSGTELTVLRVPGIYGPGRLGLDRLEAGAELLKEADSGPGNRIHVADLARCCLRALERDAPAGTYNVGDGDHRSTTAFSHAVCKLAGLPTPREIGIEEARGLWSSLRLSFVLESRRADVTRMRERLGVSPVYADPVDGIRASLAED